MDNRKKYARDTYRLLFFIAGIVIGAIGVKIQVLEQKQQDWYNNQVKISPEALEHKVEAKELEMPTPSPTLTLDTLTYKAKQCIKNNPEVASKIKERYIDWQSASNLICQESSFNSQAINKSSGACGLHQAYPCSKMDCDLSDIDCQLDWGKNYIAKRYGTITKTWLFHEEKGWY